MSHSPLRFGQPLPLGDAPSDAEFLALVAWTNRAPRGLVRAAQRGDVAAVCRHVRRHAGGLLRPAGVDEPAALWSRHAFPESPRTAELAEIVGEFDRQPGRAGVPLGRWLETAENVPPSPFELLMLLERLAHGRDLADEILWSLWRTALSAAVALSMQRDERPRSGATDDQRLLIFGELPWLAGLIFADVQGADRLRRSGQRVLRRQLLGSTDTDGTPRAELLERIAFWLAPLVRATDVARRARVELWDDDEARQRFRALVKMVSPLCVGDGRLVLSNGYAGRRVPMLLAGLRLAGWTTRQPPMRALRAIDQQPATNGRMHRISARRVRSDVLPSTQSDWARLGCLRSDWSPQADTLVVTHDGPRPRLDLSAFGRTLLSGPWELEVALDGRPLELGGAKWSCVCWNSDGDADYLELQLRLPGKLRIERQLLLSRSDRFALLADVVAGAGSRRIEYASRLPLAGRFAPKADVPTRECRLTGPQVAARVFPLALPWDRVQSAAGDLRPQGDRLELRQAAVGGLYAPLVIDWHPARRKAEADWRTLTVTEDRRLLTSAAAAGHRLRIGRHQLLVYRALQHTKESRAVLGHHTPCETVIARFDTDGTVTPLLLVE